MKDSVYASADKQTQARYLNLLSRVGSVSRLFSTSEKPYIDYRMAENIFCTTFGAENLSRSCVAVDAKIGTLGIGIKTFVDTPRQKIAEFDRRMKDLNEDPLHDAIAVSKLRNLRLDATSDSYGVNRFIYHYIVRTDRSIRIFEEPMDYIDVDRIRVTRSTSGSIQFTDGKNEYSFSRSKSTLLKNFDLDSPVAEIAVEFLDDPISALFGESGILQGGNLPLETGEVLKSVTLPLYSTRGGRHVPERSGLNQWNASGRKRNLDEVYVPLPKSIKNENPDFFPPRFETFRLILPDGTELSASVCQDDGKAIMSNPNKALGQWILRTVLHLEQGELATIEKLDRLRIDAVILTKHPNCYKMDFTYIGDDSGDGEEERVRASSDGERPEVHEDQQVRGTSPELKVRKALRDADYPRYRLNWKKAPGRPDVCYLGREMAIFVNGCFWHRCPKCNLPMPKHNSDYWIPKLERNVQRDKEDIEKLVAEGWTVVVLWGCEIKNDFAWTGPSKRYLENHDRAGPTYQKRFDKKEEVALPTPSFT